MYLCFIVKMVPYSDLLQGMGLSHAKNQVFFLWFKDRELDNLSEKLFWKKYEDSFFIKYDK